MNVDLGNVNNQACPSELCGDKDASGHCSVVGLTP